jgi:hypothetical protein
LQLLVNSIAATRRRITSFTATERHREREIEKVPFSLEYATPQDLHIRQKTGNEFVGLLGLVVIFGKLWEADRGHAVAVREKHLNLQ